MQTDHYENKTQSADTSRWNGGAVWVREVTVSPRTITIVAFRDHATLERENLQFAADPADVRTLRMGTRRARG
jgi:hypothetical protein